MKSYREPPNMPKALVAEEGPSRSPIPWITITFKIVTVCGVLAMGLGLGDQVPTYLGSLSCSACTQPGACRGPYIPSTMEDFGEAPKTCHASERFLPPERVWGGGGGGAGGLWALLLFSFCLWPSSTHARLPDCTQLSPARRLVARMSMTGGRLMAGLCCSSGPLLRALVGGQEGSGKQAGFPVS